MDTSFLVSPQNEAKAILVVDASGSTAAKWHNLPSIFSKFELIANQMQHTEYRIVFWNSNTEDSSYKPGGIMKFPFSVDKSKLAMTFKVAKDKITPYCLTMPDLGFRAIHDWLDSGYSRTVHFMTDGMVGPQAGNRTVEILKRDLATEIKAITTKHRDVQLYIHAVENKVADFGSVESMARSAGNDVYKVISDNNLTNVVSKFTSYTINYPDGHHHMNKVKTPVGCVPYGAQYFSERDTSKFLAYIYQEIKSNAKNEDLLLKIVQNLAGTLNTLIQDKPSNIRGSMIRMFCDMFQDTCIDAVMINFILVQSITAESKGSAALFAEYRSNLNNLYQNANKMLQDDAKSALGISQTVITLPIRQTGSDQQVVIVSGNHAVDQSILGFKSSGIKVEDKVMPVLPYNCTLSGNISEQCLRQWIRAILAKDYNLPVTADEIIYVMMMINFQVQYTLATLKAAGTPHTDEEGISSTYKKLVTAMLRKKRMNTDTTELARLLEGHLPIPNNGKIESFNRFMVDIAGRLKLSVSPMEMWYYLCLAVSDELVTAQYLHCKGELKNGRPSITNVQITPLQFWGYQEQLEYVCLITMGPTDKTGGYKFQEHKNLMGQKCQPRQVLSEEGLKELLKYDYSSRCPICYATLSQANFEQTPPYNPAEGQQYQVSNLQTDHFNVQQNNNNNNNNYSNNNSNNNYNYSNNNSHSKNNNKGQQPTKGKKVSGTPGTLVVLMGTVGSGKSTYGRKLKSMAEKEGYHTIIEGMDQYTINGTSGGDAAKIIKEHVYEMLKINGKKMLIMDLCNENFRKNDVFGINLENWEIKQVWVNYDEAHHADYMAWSLRNVMKRQMNEAVLNPERAGISTCIEVHEKKASKHWGPKLGSTPISDRAKAHSVSDVLNQINNAADRYAEYLAQNEAKFQPQI